MIEPIVDHNFVNTFNQQNVKNKRQRINKNTS